MVSVSPRTSVMLLGGFGVPNWGDEYILDMLLRTAPFRVAGIDRAFLVTANAGMSAWIQRDAPFPMVVTDALFWLPHHYPELATLSADVPTELAAQILAEVEAGSAPIQARSLVYALRSCRAVHFCGGGYLYDAWEGALMAFALVVALAKTLGIPVTASGVSPCARTEAGFEILASMVRNLAVFDVRDQIDLRFSALRSDTSVTCDDAFPATIAARVQSCGEATRISLLLTRNPELPERFEASKSHCRAVLLRMARDRPIAIAVLNHVAPAAHDWADLDDVISPLIAAGVVVDHVDLSLMTPREGLAVFARADVAIVDRFHAMLGHLNVGVPVMTCNHSDLRFQAASRLLPGDALRMSDLADPQGDVAALQHMVAKGLSHRWPLAADILDRKRDVWDRIGAIWRAASAPRL